MKKPEHKIKNVVKKSPAWKAGLLPGDILLRINGQEIVDVFDYEYYAEDEVLDLEILRGEETLCIHVEKDVDTDLGLEFDNGLMDEYRSCHNKCIFCFIDQMPKGMRETLYFKDDDSRLSFLQGNYITLTNLSEDDVNRICKYHLSPINISFQTTNPELRCMMLHNRFAGEALAKVDRFVEANITMNGQIVLCKGVNDGAELERTIRDLTKYAPLLQSVSVVPVGLTKFREGLYPLEAFTKEDALATLEIIHKWQDYCFEKWGIHFVHASDEWYLLAELDMPEEDRYDGYLQLENGVGMIRLQRTEFDEAFDALLNNKKMMKKLAKRKEHFSIATGRLAYPAIKEFADRVAALSPDTTIDVYAIRNDFFGEKITVAGLLTAQDIIAQLSGKDLGSRLLLPQCVLRSGEDVFLDDLHVPDVENALHVKLDIVKSSGQDLLESLL